MFGVYRLNAGFLHAFARRSGVASAVSTAACFLGLLLVSPAAASTSEKIATSSGNVERVLVHGRSLEGNLMGDSPDRNVSIYLPPSYTKQPSRRYPVLYLLHGFTQTDLGWFGQPGSIQYVPDMLDRAIAAGANEMIVVTPNAMTVYGGSNYSSGQNTGDWETFISQELVSWVDSHYRTNTSREQRAIAGHSMGGMGAMRIGMRHADIFGTVYLLSPCCLAPENNIPKKPADIAAIEAFRTRPSRPEDVPESIRTAVAASASWAPNPDNPPTYFDSPFKDGQRQEAVIARMTANRPLVLVDQYIGALKTQAIAFDVGDEDLNISANLKELDRILTAYGVEHLYEVYPGNHTNRIPERIELQMIPFVSQRFR